MLSTRSAWLVVSSLALSASASCGLSLPDPAADAEKLWRANGDVLASNAKHCGAERKTTEPDLFGWDSGSRGKVKATAEQGLVVVRFEERGCDIAISVLNCTSAKTHYRYTPRHAQQSRVAENDGDLYAHFPVAVADLRARLGQNRGIRADYRMEGIDMIPIGASVERRDLVGNECSEATHVVRAIHRGAFAVASAAFSELRADGTLFDAALKQRLAVFDGDGFADACEAARTKGVKTNGCDEPLRIELQPLSAETTSASVATRVEEQTKPVIAEPPAKPAPRSRNVLAAARVVTPAPPPPPAPTRAAVRVAVPAPGSSCPAAMASIPGGSFVMGSDDGEPEERPARNAFVGPYCLDVTEVTVAAYARCPTCRAPAEGPQCNAPGHGKDDHPQNCVSWDDALVFCTARGATLPTEAQWEFAARGGPQEHAWPWGNARPTPNHACWNRLTTQALGTCPVASFSDSSFGLHDMAGNVWEWVADWYGPHPPGTPEARSDHTTGAGRVLRGGGWSTSKPNELRGSNRAGMWPTNRDDYLGFRCAWSPP